MVFWTSDRRTTTLEKTLIMTDRKYFAGTGILFSLLLLIGVTGCFEVDESSPKKLRVLFTSDVIGNVEPCG